MNWIKRIDAVCNVIIAVAAVVGAMILFAFNIIALVVAIIVGAAWRH